MCFGGGNLHDRLLTCLFLLQNNIQKKKKLKSYSFLRFWTLWIWKQRDGGRNGYCKEVKFIWLFSYCYNMFINREENYKNVKYFLKYLKLCAERLGKNLGEGGGVVK